MLEPSNNAELPAIPGKRYFTIGEVSDLCGVKPHAKVSKRTKRIAPSSRRRIRKVPSLACGRGVTRRLSAIVGDSQPARHE